MLNSAHSLESMADVFDFLFNMFFGKAQANVARSAVQNIYQIPYLYYLQAREGGLPANDGDPLSIDEVLWCYRIFLLREPENFESLMSHLAGFESRNRLFTHFLFSYEFTATQIRHLQLAFPDAERVLLIHIPKTGGASLREWVRERVANVMVLHDVKNVDLRIPSDLESARRRIVLSGHRTWGSWSVSPRDKVFSVVREPLERVVSYYKYIQKLAVNPDPREFSFFQHLLGLQFKDLMQSTQWIPASEQCQYLSNEGTFQAVVANTKVFDLSICTLDNVAAVGRKLAAALGIEYTELPRLNHTDDVAAPSYSADELVGFHEVNKEDFVLYLYLRAIEASRRDQPPAARPTLAIQRAPSAAA